ncbi:MAG: hypothetical protein MI741_19880 [Rhodospirillales bacterium]|nr:hypothetical protein [Rhodospirillales bacterium]
MQMSIKSRAEQLFAATGRKDGPVIDEREKARRERKEHIANLRALRLAKEAADKQAAE